MKAKTRILNAVKRCYNAYAEWSDATYSIPVKAPVPKIEWRGGRGPGSGWMIDGQLWPTLEYTTDRIVAHFEEMASQWFIAARTK